MPASPSDPLRLLVLGRHTPSGGLLVQVERTSARRVLHDRAAPGSLGPLATSRGTFWAAPWAPVRSVWDLVVGHPEGLSEGAVVACLQRLAGRGEGRFDLDEVWVTDGGDVVDAAAGERTLADVARYLLRGEAAHARSPDDPPLVAALDAEGEGALAAWTADDAAWGAAVARVPAEDPDPTHPLTGEILEVGAAPGPASPDKGVMRRAMARAGVLMLLLGLAAGSMLTSPPPAAPPGLRVEVPGAEVVQVVCEGGGDVVTLRRCRVEARIDDVPHAGPLDTTGHGMYDCRAREGGFLACGPR